ncbi:MAG: hypothetical protein M1834_005961 [Cirrosporium novae-zelandiae]|nr:MAG: hypothetical protein M1834_005961 [Cirrosporium novae-zelandiae]
MPSPSTPQRSSNRRSNNNTPPTSKSATAPNPLFPPAPNPGVRDKIRAWQEHGGGVIVQEDIGPGDEEPEPEKPKTPKSKLKETASAISNTSTATSRKSAKKDRTERETYLSEREKLKRATSPKKRIVSDEHWRKDKKDKSPTKPDESLCGSSSQISLVKSKKDDKEKKTHDADGKRIYSTPKASRSRTEHLKPPPGEDSGSKSGNKSGDERLHSHNTPSPSHKKSSELQTQDVESESELAFGASAATHANDRKHSRRKSKASGGSPKANQGAFPEGRANSRSHKPGILKQVFEESKKAFAKPDPVPPQIPKGSRIEAWLEKTPDPFLEGDDDEPPVEIPAPLRTSKRKKQDDKIIEKESSVDHEDKKEHLDEPSSEKRRERRQERRSQRRSTSDISDIAPLNPDLTSTERRNSTSSYDSKNQVNNESKTADSSPSLRRNGGTRRERTSPRTRGRRESSAIQADTIDEEPGRDSLPEKSPELPSEERDIIESLRPPGLNIKRAAPRTGRYKLSTIASVETLDSNIDPTATEITITEDEQSELRDAFDPYSLPGKKTSLKRRLTKHSDLISVLSVPHSSGRSIRSARSIRTNRSRLATATVDDLMQELVADEKKYMPELWTLVEGVIPVLLTCVLSKADSALAAGLFHAPGVAVDDPNFTRPIIDMGIALERMKTLHKRIPEHDPERLLRWAQGAQKAYSDYLKSWRLGFQDVVVNLAPSEEDKAKGADPGKIDEGLPRNADGDVVNNAGERVDVAFLLKRPLVRLKYLAKTFKGINILKPSPTAEKMAMEYQSLVTKARQRLNEERARLEDETAAAIDPTRARDPCTLAPLSNVSIDQNRRVRARDLFDLRIQHTSGQLVDCRAELLLRDDPPERGNSGDLLICEVDGAGRCLLFPPVTLGRVSARNGDSRGEIVVMIRGITNHGGEWQELMVLATDDEQAGFEWVQMLGLSPVPPKITKSLSFLEKRKKQAPANISPASSALSPAPVLPTGKSRTPSPTEVDVPIGEQGTSLSKRWTPSTEKLDGNKSPPTTPREPEARRREVEPSPPATPIGLFSRFLMGSPEKRDHPSPESARSPRSQPTSPSSSGLRRSGAKRRSRHPDDMHSPDSEPDEHSFPSSMDSRIRGSPKERTRSPEPIENSPPGSPPSDTASPPREKGRRSRYHRAPSSVPSLDLPHIPKIRKNSSSSTLSATSEKKERPSSMPTTPVKSPDESHKRSSSDPKDESAIYSDDVPAPPAHRTPSPVRLKSAQTPVLSPSGVRNVKRRSSSPLKHEYEPSTASESGSESEASTVEHYEISDSEYSDEEDLEGGDVPTPLLPNDALPKFSKVSPPSSLPSLAKSTLAPSNSASQAPYQTVPSQPSKAQKAIGSIFSWSDKGIWESLHPDECSIVISPGLIEAFELTANHSRPHTSSGESVSSSDNGEKPLVALELTPLVPLRRGTALDISIRSPPTPRSKIKTSSNIMFRSRNPEECETLYAMINYARINNPTYIALQNARGPFDSYQGPSRQPSVKGSRSSWFGWGSSRSSYRASSAPTPSLQFSESSVGTMSSAFSALRRFSGSRLFNISRSTIGSRHGGNSHSNSIYSSSDGSGTVTPETGDPNKGSPIGLSNAKIRLYQRETASKWRDMGSARLTIMQPVNGAHPPSHGPGSHRPTGQEKRILINGKTKGEVLLDVCLGESCFERVARTGIAVSVWEESGEGGMMKAIGGVSPATAKIYMIQMKSEAETAYTFSLVGKLRY